MRKITQQQPEVPRESLTEPARLMLGMYERMSNPQLREQEILKKKRENYGYKSFR